MLLRVRVVGMHLHGKLFFRKNKFHEQRNARQPAQTRSRPFLRQRGPHVGKRAPRKFARGKYALVARQPRFTDQFFFLGTVRKQGREVARAPNARQENRGKPRRRPPRTGGSRIHLAASAIEQNFSSRRSPSSMRSIEVA